MNWAKVQTDKYLAYVTTNHQNRRNDVENLPKERHKSNNNRSNPVGNKQN